MKNTFWLILYKLNGLAMSEATLKNAGVDPFDDKAEPTGPALFKNEYDAQDAAAEYEYFVLGQGGEPADILLAEFVGDQRIQTVEVL